MPNLRDRSQDYIVDPDRCPECKKLAVDRDQEMNHDGTLFCRCLECRKEWVEEWELTGISEIG